jgi:hypothetical protein
MTFVPVYKGESKLGADGYWHRERNQCPFSVRDLLNDECYSGNGVNRCKFFVRYDHEKHEGCVACTHPPVEEQEPTLF